MSLRRRSAARSTCEAPKAGREDSDAAAVPDGAAGVAGEAEVADEDVVAEASGPVDVGVGVSLAGADAAAAESADGR